MFLNDTTIPARGNPGGLDESARPKAKFIAFPPAVKDDPRHTLTSLRVLELFHAYGFKVGFVWWSNEGAAKKLGIPLSTFREALARNVAMGHLRLEYPGRSKKLKTGRYIHLNWIENPAYLEVRDEWPDLPKRTKKAPQSPHQINDSTCCISNTTEYRTSNSPECRISDTNVLKPQAIKSLSLKENENNSGADCTSKSDEAQKPNPDVSKLPQRQRPENPESIQVRSSEPSPVPFTQGALTSQDDFTTALAAESELTAPSEDPKFGPSVESPTDPSVEKLTPAHRAKFDGADALKQAQYLKMLLNNWDPCKVFPELKVQIELPKRVEKAEPPPDASLADLLRYLPDAGYLGYSLIPAIAAGLRDALNDRLQSNPFFYKIVNEVATRQYPPELLIEPLEKALSGSVDNPARYFVKAVKLNKQQRERQIQDPFGRP